MNRTDEIASARAASKRARVIRQQAASVLALATALLLAAMLWPVKAFAQTEAAPPAPSSLIVKLVPGLTIDQQAAVIARNGGAETSTVPALRLHVVEVGAAQLDQALARYTADVQVARVEVNAVRQSNTVPTDPLYSQQWALPRIGWDLAFGTTNPIANVVVAVLDTGIDGAHPDLAGNVIAGTSILDGSNGLSDPSGHGTMVAGTVAARTNTASPEGIAGVGYAGVRLMPVTVLNADGLGQDSDIINGVVWAVDHGADVILMAFSNPGFSASLQEAIDYAWSSNVVLVAATGNDGMNAPTYPAGDRGVIGVSATDESDQRASFSNYGASVFLAAPGTSIVTTDAGGSYVTISGTSSSAAIVAGAAAQMMAVDPSLSNGVVVGRLARTADPAGTQEETGNGRINLARALLDTGIDFVQPAGAGAAGGPFVGPYRAAATSLTSISVGSQNGTVASGVGGSVTFSIVVNSNGNGKLTNISVTGLPSGATFAPTPALPITCNASGAGCNFTLTVTTSASTPAGSFTFTVTVQSDSNNNNTASSTGTLTIGKGNQTISVTTPAPGSAAFNSSFGVAATTTSGLAVAITTTGGCSGGGNGSAAITMTSASTACVVHYNQAGNANFNAAPEVTSTTVATKANQTITVTQHAPASATFNASFIVKATASSGLNVSVAGSGVCSGSGTDTGSGVSITMTAGSGSCTVTYSQAGDANYSAVTPNVVETTTALKANQTISFGALADKTFGDPDFSVNATATSGLAVSFNPSGNCAVAGNFVHITGAGSCTITASQAGNANYNAAPDVPQSFNIAKAGSFTAVSCPASVTYTGVPQTPCTATVTGAGGLSLAPTPTYANNTDAGTATANYTYAGDANHTGSSDSKNFTIDKANTATSVVSSQNPATADQNVSFTATVTPGAATGTVQFVVNGVNYGSPVALTAGAATIGFTNKTAGTYTVSASYSGDTNYNGSGAALSPDQQINPGAPSKLAFGAQPTDTQAGQAITPAVTVRVLDAADNLVPTDTSTVTIAISTSGMFQAGSTTAVAAAAGIATFDNLKPTKAGTFTLSAIDGALIAAQSGSFNVSAGPAVTFAFGVPPTKTAGESFDITVYAKDTFDNTATGYMGVVHFTSSDAHAGLPADANFTAGDHGATTIVGQTMLKTSGHQTITATDTVASSITGTSATILVNPGNATVLIVTAPAAIETAGVAFDVMVEAQDAYGNTATGYAGTIHFDSSDPKADPPDDYTFVPATDAGIQAFSVNLHSAGQWTVKATDVASHFFGVSGTITVQPGPPAKLAFRTQPGNTFVGVAIPNFSVEVRDADDNLVDNDNGNLPISVALGTNPTGVAVLSGTTSVNAVHGVATFTGLMLNKAATGYTLKATSGTLIEATSATFDVGKGTATLSLSGLSHTYDGSPKSATVTTTPVGLTGVSITYNGSGTAPTNAGSYPVIASLLNDDYAASDATGTLVIAKASSTTTVTFEPAPYVFRGTAFTATARVTGAGGLDGVVPVVYTGDCTNVSPGGCTATATFAGDANHEGSSDAKSITITKGDSTTTLTFESGPYAYRGTAFTATATVTGSGGLNGPVSVVYFGDCTNVTGANGCTATATFAGDQNHNGSTDGKSITITKAGSTTVVTFENGPYTYRGTAFTATATVNGVGGLNSAVSVVYSGDCTNVTGPNGCTATATFAGDQNHNGSTDSKSTTITKASSTTVVTFESGPYTYRATAFTATATVTGVAGLNSTVAVVYSGDCANVTAANGCTATATYGGDQNHDSSTDSKNITITKASSTTVVTFESGPYVYRASAFTATAMVSGVGGLSGPVSVTYSGDCTNVTAPNGCTGSATYAGDTNHDGSSDAKNITITKAISATVVTFENGPYVYRATAFAATAAVTGIGGLNGPVSVLYTGDCTNVTMANGCTGTATYAGDANHDGSSNSRSITIARASSTTIVTCPANVVYTGYAQTPCAAGVAGVGGLNLSLPVSYGSNIDAGTATASAAFGGDTNHLGSVGSTTFVIAKAATTTVVTVANATFDGTPHGATAQVTGPALSQALLVYYAGTNGTNYASTTPPTDAGQYTASAAYADTANYIGSSDAQPFTIGKANQVIGLIGVPASASYGATFTVSSTITNTPAGPGSGNPVIPASSGGCVNNDALYTMIVNVAAPVCTVTATLAGNANYNDAPPVTMNVNPSGGVIVPVHGEVHIVDPGKWGICGTNPSNGQAHAECKLWPDSTLSDGFPEAGDVVVRLYDLKNATLQSQYGKDPGPDRYRDVYTSNVGLVGTCMPKRESPTPNNNGKLVGFGEALCGAPAATDILVLAGYKDFADLKGKPRANVDINVVFGKKVDGGSFKSTPTNNKLSGSLRTSPVPSGAGILWSDVRDIHAQKTIRKDPKDCVYGGTNTAATTCIVQYADAGKTVYTGSYLEIIYPTYTVWDEGQTKYLYPFIMSSDSEWTLDVCAAVPQGYQIVGVYDADGSLVASADCIQAGVAGETKIVAFEVLDLQSPPPRLTAKLKIKHKGKTVNDQLDIPGKRKGKDR
ncbi:MAG TPA: S8 family serine peptidase [Trinickia sp.]|nr:S8 family serine peptidase [Trinickia sp.]